MISNYFALTTLTTVGFGDFSPQNDYEKIFSIFIMILGVAMFSFVMGSLTDLITSYDKYLGKVVHKEAELQNWINLLTKFTKREVIDSELLTKIENHFNYFWINNRNYSISKDDKYLESLPISLKNNLMEILWGDVFNNFWNFFYYIPSYIKMFPEFYYRVAFLFMPRR